MFSNRSNTPCSKADDVTETLSAVWHMHTQKDNNTCTMTKSWPHGKLSYSRLLLLDHRSSSPIPSNASFSTKLFPLAGLWFADAGPVVRPTTDTEDNLSYMKNKWFYSYE